MKQELTTKCILLGHKFIDVGIFQICKYCHYYKAGYLKGVSK